MGNFLMRRVTKSGVYIFGTASPVSGTWKFFAASANGAIIYAAESTTSKLYKSTNYGTSFAQIATGNAFGLGVACSSTGAIVVSVDAAGYLSLSVDSGTTWTGPALSITGYSGGAYPSMSSSGSVIAVCGAALGSGLYISTNSGSTFTNRNPVASTTFKQVIVSADGTKILALTNAGVLYRSTDTGVTWALVSGTGVITYIAASGDLVSIIISTATGVSTSQDSGASWQPKKTLANITGVASSSDGAILGACTATVGSVAGDTYTSVDSGDNWAGKLSAATYNAIFISGDGTTLCAGRNPGVISTQVTARAIGVGTNALSATAYKVMTTTGKTKTVVLLSSGQLQSSVDGCVTWNNITTPTTVASFTMSADGVKMQYSSNTKLLYYSLNSGGTWTVSSLAAQGLLIGINSSSDGSVVAVLAYNVGFSTAGICYSVDSGQTYNNSLMNSNYTTESSYGPSVTPAGQVLYTASGGSNAIRDAVTGTVYLAAGTQLRFKSLDGTGSFLVGKLAGNSPPYDPAGTYINGTLQSYQGVTVLAVPYDGSSLIATYQGVVQQTTNNGNTWTPRPTLPTVAPVGVVPSAATLIYAINNRLYFYG